MRSQGIVMIASGAGAGYRGFTRGFHSFVRLLILIF